MHRLRYSWLRHFLSRLQWTTEQDSVALTFDDGPHPEITPWVLDLLRQANMKATFFLVGDAVDRNPDILEILRGEGHSIGGHSMRHMDLWNSNSSEYIQDVLQAQRRIDTKLFRPPYGHMLRSVAKTLLESDEVDEIIMWSLLSGDYNTNISPQQCWENIEAKLKPTDILVFHDSEKAKTRLEYALPETINLILKKGWKTSTF